MNINSNESALLTILIQMILIIASAHLSGLAAARVGQPRVVGEIVGGIAVGAILFSGLIPIPDSLLALTSSSPITIIAQLGLILFTFQIGLEFDFTHLRNPTSSRAIIWISTVGVAVPFVTGALVGLLSWPYLAPYVDRLSYTLFVATAFSITALPVLGRIMIEFNLNRTQIGAITITAAAVNDVIGWLLLTLATAITLGHSSVFDFSARIFGIGAFVGISWWIARPALRWLVNRLGAGDQYLPTDLLAIMLLVIFSAAVLTQRLGVFTVFGAFMVGTLLHDQKDFVAAWRRYVGKFVLVFFLPVFFTYTGMRIRISGFSAIEMWFWCLLFTLTAMLSKFGSCYWAAKHVGINTYEAIGIAIMMNTRALMELVVLNIGADLGILPRTVFTMLVIMAITSTLITAPVLHAISSRYPSILPTCRVMNY